MKHIKSLISIILTGVIMLGTFGQAFAVEDFAFKITDMTTEYMENPVGIDSDCVRFGWKMASSHIGKRQTAYELTVYDNNTAVWNSGKVESNLSVGVNYGGKKLKDETRYTWNVKVWDERGNTITSENAFFEIGVTDTAQWKNAEFIALKDSYSAPVFRMEKALSGKLTRARLYITALGVYKAFVNENEVYSLEKGERIYHHMNPGYGNGNVSLGYQTYDVTDLIDGDTVALSALCGTGWYNGMWSTASSPALKALLVLTYEDGEKEYIGSNTTDWKGSLNGGITANGIYYGEDYDARKARALGDFTKAKYDDSEWLCGDDMTVKSYEGNIRARVGTVGKVLDEYTTYPISAIIYTGTKAESEYPGGEINTDKVYTCESGENLFDGGVTLKKGSTMVVNMGQNMSAVPEIEFSAKEGTILTMRFAEMLNDGSKVGTEATDADGPKGSVYQKSLRGARSQVHYTFAGKEKEHYKPLTSFFGYQYVELTATDDVTVYYMKSNCLSSVSEQTGYIETNNQNVNKLFSNVLYGQLSNYFTTSTDCNQRDERSFWSGDTQAFAQTGLYNFNSLAFFEDLQGIMNENTMIKGYTPAIADDLEGYFSNWAAGWSDVLVIVPWTVYLQTGDVNVLRSSYEAMTKYMDYLKKNERGLNQAPLSNINFGDWLSFQGTSVEVISDYYYGYVTEIMKKTADILGEERDYKKYSRKFDLIKAAFLLNHVTFIGDKLTIKSGKGDTSKQFHYDAGKGGKWENNSQTALLWMLKLKFYSCEKMKNAAIKLLVENIKNANPADDSIRAEYGKNTLAVGFLGSNVLLPVLSEIGESDTAFDLLLQNENPSWLFEVKAGATTIWERWNSYVPGKGFGDSEMNSFNHYAYGSVAEWMYRYMLGIDHSEESVGFKKVILQPTFDCGTMYNDEVRISDVKGSYNSPYGEIAVSYESDSGKLISYKAEIPANTSAELYLSISEEAVKNFTDIDGVMFKGMTTHNGKECAKFILSSGGYNFTVSDNELKVNYADGYTAEDFIPENDEITDDSFIAKIKAFFLKIRQFFERLFRCDK